MCRVKNPKIYILYSHGALSIFGKSPIDEEVRETKVTDQIWDDLLRWLLFSVLGLVLNFWFLIRSNDSILVNVTIFINREEDACCKRYMTLARISFGVFSIVVERQKVLTTYVLCLLNTHHSWIRNFSVLYWKLAFLIKVNYSN